MIKRIAYTAVLFGMVATAPAALAQVSCAPRDNIVTKLENTYGESRTGAGLKGTTSIYEIWASEDSGTWTILLTNPDGVSCIMASGEYWRDLPKIRSIQDTPA